MAVPRPAPVSPQITKSGWSTKPLESSRPRLTSRSGRNRNCDPSFSGPASENFAEFVAARRGVRTRWGVPSTVFWYISGEYYLGTLVVRHRLTPELAEVGGHVGYHVVAPWRRQGHATRMLAAGLVECRRLGISRVLLTCDRSNEPSRKVILANGGEPDGQTGGEDRFWIRLDPSRSA